MQTIPSTAAEAKAKASQYGGKKKFKHIATYKVQSPNDWCAVSHCQFIHPVSIKSSAFGRNS